MPLIGKLATKVDPRYMLVFGVVDGDAVAVRSRRT